MSISIKIIYILILNCTCTFAFAGNVYVCEKNGSKFYQDTPCDADENTIKEYEYKSEAITKPKSTNKNKVKTDKKSEEKEEKKELTIQEKAQNILNKFLSKDSDNTNSEKSKNSKPEDELGKMEKMMNNTKCMALDLLKVFGKESKLDESHTGNCNK